MSVSSDATSGLCLVVPTGPQNTTCRKNGILSQTSEPGTRSRLLPASPDASRNLIGPFLHRTGGAGIAGETRKALAATRTHALTHARPRPAGRQARARTRPASAPEARALSGLCCGGGGGGCCESPSTARAETQTRLRRSPRHPPLSPQSPRRVLREGTALG